MLVCDVDGTLLDSHGRLSERTAEAVAAVVASGVPVVLASGRILAGLAPLCARLGLTGPQIAVHGALVATPGGRVVAQFPLSAGDVHAHLAFGRDIGAPTILCWATHLVADRLTQDVVAAFEPYDEPMPEVHPDLDALAGLAPLKTTLCLDVDSYEGARRAAVARFGDRYTATSANERQLELVQSEATKASAAHTVAAALGIPMAEIAAIGDGPNDVELLGSAGLSAAMGNARPEVRAAASFVVPTCDEDGAAVAIARLFPDLPL
jgi:Cof subfamily protein (haloacid dehalogenase superfamily)